MAAIQNEYRSRALPRFDRCVVPRHWPDCSVQRSNPQYFRDCRAQPNRREVAGFGENDERQNRPDAGDGLQPHEIALIGQPRRHVGLELFAPAAERSIFLGTTRNMRIASESDETGSPTLLDAVS